MDNYLDGEEKYLLVYLKMENNLNLRTFQSQDYSYMSHKSDSWLVTIWVIDYDSCRMSTPFQFKKVIQVAAGHEHILLLAEKQTDVRFIF